jgi:16S rRNA (cytosine1402-N4)-methyltransferase
MPDEPQARTKRRPRYRGKHPRRFEEKYKEHNPERYSAEVAQIVASGKTPAGSHRPILVAEILSVLNPQPGESAVDATLGYGGHAIELLQRVLPNGRVLALDVDPIELPKTEHRLRLAGFGPEVLTIRRSNFAGLPQAMSASGFEQADIILADLGLSSMQIDNPARGFTFKWDGPFDLRMNPERGQPASVFVSRLSVDELAAVLHDNADEPQAQAIAASMARAAAAGHLTSTLHAAEAIRGALESGPSRWSGHEADVTIRRVFQAIRIAVNDEFGALNMFLRHLPSCLKPGGRVAILTFHSGEDRRVKQALQLGLTAGDYSSIAQDVVRPSEEEIRSNPRASSAKLRWARKSLGGEEVRT